MVDKKNFILGLDLHGTLLEPGEAVPEDLVKPIAGALKKLEGRVERFLATGNDLEFVYRKVPRPIMEQIDGCVLETGCSVCLDGRKEKILTNLREQETIRALDRTLRGAGFPEINYFAHRLTTISMFCDQPKVFHEKVVDYVGTTRFAELVDITYSSVAVDILPRGYNKYRGLSAVADGKKTIGVADSMNDKALLMEADYALAPSNINSELSGLLEREGRTPRPLSGANQLIEQSVLTASQTESRGVLEILEFLDGTI